MLRDSLNPVLLHLGPLEVRWYGLLYVIGIVFCYFFVQWYAKAHKLKITKEQVNDLIFFLVLGLVIGGRLGYCLFYDPLYFLRNPLAIFKVWEGGMSFHGGFALGLLFSWLYCRRHKLKFLKTADLFIIPIPIALAMGRIGNFINGELWGKPTSLPWGFSFPNAPDSGTIARHPSQLYEVLKNLAIFAGLWLLSKKKEHRDGFLLFCFLFLYGMLRIAAEFFRAPETIIVGVTMGQWLSIPLVIIGAIGVAMTWKR